MVVLYKTLDSEQSSHFSSWKCPCSYRSLSLYDDDRTNVYAVLGMVFFFRDIQALTYQYVPALSIRGFNNAKRKKANGTVAWRVYCTPTCVLDVVISL